MAHLTGQFMCLVLTFGISWSLNISWTLNSTYLGRSCDSDGDCPFNQLCLNDSCSRGATGTGVRCSKTKPCPDTYPSCHEGECTCSISEQCATPKVCTEGTCKPAIECRWIRECPRDGQRCVFGRCESPAEGSQCEDGDDCPEDVKCVDNICTIPFHLKNVILWVIIPSIVAAFLIVLVYLVLSTQQSAPSRIAKAAIPANSVP